MNRIVRSGFTLLELLVVIAIVAILAAALFGAYVLVQQKIKVAKAKNTLVAIEVALEQYKTDFHAYPPDDTFANGSETLWFYLCRVQKSGSTERSYLGARDYQLDDVGGGNRKFKSPLGGEYEYRQLIDSDGVKRMCLVADPGLDKLLGGTIDPDKGFVTSSAQAAKDNLYSAVLPK
ncbi:MAG TPA: prepilin-type N-terminal cleavage/methylation domain-containing protein [Planctomycetota bacterium]|nr:prepilin-type N-terminal cleavage/methylation domain-containing protein [Planctomycetota bacterium]